MDGEAAEDDEFGGADGEARLRELEEIRCIGRGATGQAILARAPRSGRLYVVKHILLPALPEQGSLGVEVEALQRLEHPNVVRFYGSYLDRAGAQPKRCIAMEYCDSGTLAQWMQLRWDAVHEDERWGLISEDEIMACFAQIVEGLAHVHAKKVLHRDLKGARRRARPARGGHASARRQQPCVAAWPRGRARAAQPRTSCCTATTCSSWVILA